MLETIINKAVAVILVCFLPMVFKTPVNIGTNVSTATVEVSTKSESSNCESIEEVFTEIDDSINQSSCDLNDEESLELNLEPTPTVVPTPELKPSPTPTASSKQTNGFGSFKSWTNYKVLNKNSTQWYIQKKAYTDSNGLRKIDDFYLCAIGTGWGIKLGEKAVVHLSTGISFNIIMCDIKADRHTDSITHTYTVKNGCVVEFYVEESKLHKSVRIHGTVSKLDMFSGDVVSIDKI